MVGFSSGGENPHGVRAVTSGQRCAVALWFTLDPLFRELVKITFLDRVITGPVSCCFRFQDKTSIKPHQKLGFSPICCQDLRRVLD